LNKLSNKHYKKALLGCSSVMPKVVAYNGFYTLSMQHSEYSQDTKQFLEVAMKDEVPSVKAKIRNIMKKGFQ